MLPTNNFKLSQERADQVLRKMVDNDVITNKILLSSGSTQRWAVNKSQRAISKSPYFTDWIKEQLYDYIGPNDNEIIVKTTLDPNLQRMARDSLKSNLNNVGKSKNIEQGAFVALSPEGDVLAMVGGKSYNESQFNRVTQAYRQPRLCF